VELPVQLFLILPRKGNSASEEVFMMAGNVQDPAEADVQRYLNDPTIQTIMAIRQGQMRQAQEAEARRLKEAEKYRTEGLTQIQEFVNSIPEQDRKAPAIIHDIQAFTKRLERDAELKAIDPNSKSAEFERQRIKDMYGDPKDFIDTDAFKQAEQTAQSTKTRFESAFRLGKSIDEMQRILEEKGEEAANQYGRTSLMKELNSLWGSDAVGLSEAVLRYNQLIPIQLQNQISGKSMFEVANIITKFMSDPRNKADTINSLASGLSNMFIGDPRGMMDVARSMQDVSAKGHNENVRLLSERTSPYHIKRLGVQELESVNERDKRLAKEAAMAAAGGTQMSGGQYSGPTQIQTTSGTYRAPGNDPRVEIARKALNDPNASEQHKAAARKILGQ
jgi:hypothetical protein